MLSTPIYRSLLIVSCNCIIPLNILECGIYLTSGPVPRRMSASWITSSLTQATWVIASLNKVSIIASLSSFFWNLSTECTNRTCFKTLSYKAILVSFSNGVSEQIDSGFECFYLTPKEYTYTYCCSIKYLASSERSQRITLLLCHLVHSVLQSKKDTQAANF